MRYRKNNLRTTFSIEYRRKKREGRKKIIICSNDTLVVVEVEN